jgi:hypothetical protein
MNTRWRLAFMFDAAGGDLGRLERALTDAGGRIRELAGDAHLRMGVADQHPGLAAPRGRGDAEPGTVDGAVEISVAAARVGDLAALSRSMRGVLEGLAAASSVQVMTGPVFPIVPVRDGGAFLSLAFRRYPGTTSRQFRDWWLHQHAGVATPILGPGLLAYDQVHVDPAATQAVSRAFGAEPAAYDAYDNLTWEDADAFLRSISDAAGMARIFADEVGRIDDPSRRHALMRKIG